MDPRTDVLDLASAPSARPSEAHRWSELSSATAHLDPPYAVIDRDALARNARDMLRRAGGVPIRVASKSIRVRAVLQSVLSLPGYQGVLAFTLPEALWLASGPSRIDDIVVGYPSVDRSAIGALAADERLARSITLMIDSVDHLDAVDAVIPPDRRPTIRVCIDLDASWRSWLLGHIGVHRSPIHSPMQAFDLAAHIVRRPGFALVGIMAYEAQVAGVQDFPPGRPLFGLAARFAKMMSIAELAERRAATVRAVRSIADLEFVNGGGTGSIETTAADSAVTEIAAGSGLFGPTLFDRYATFRPEPAAAFALPVVRIPQLGIATVMGGGWIASGPPGADRLPSPAWPTGLRYLPREGAGEVQTPLAGVAARDLRVGDRVWFRHAKAGELSEHVDVFHVVAGGKVVGEVPTYRGEGEAFL